eukprot:m.95917 g.95917  ORF g.95917 m.95917 type:complete len:225 (-) comp15171_c0_seq1:101-775(-)
MVIKSVGGFLGQHVSMIRARKQGRWAGRWSYLKGLSSFCYALPAITMLGLVTAETLGLDGGDLLSGGGVAGGVVGAAATMIQASEGDGGNHAGGHADGADSLHDYPHMLPRAWEASLWVTQALVSFCADGLWPGGGSTVHLIDRLLASFMFVMAAFKPFYACSCGIYCYAIQAGGGLVAASFLSRSRQAETFDDHCINHALWHTLGPIAVAVSALAESAQACLA